MLTELEKMMWQIRNGEWGLRHATNKYWGGAGVLVELPDPKLHKKWVEDSCQASQQKNDSSTMVIKSKHASSISSVFYALRDLFQPYLDYQNKYDFFGRLGNAAQHSGTIYETAVLINIMEEAIQMAYEILGKPYFAYGSNMDVDQMRNRCSTARIGPKISLKGYQFIINTNGVATILEDKDHSVEGIIWWILPEDEKNLDTYEGVSAGCYRKEYPIQLEMNGYLIQPLIYLATNTTPGSSRPNYIERIIVWAARHGFSPDYIKELESWANLNS